MLLLALVACLQDTAEQTLSKTEKALQEGKSLTVKLKGTFASSSESGEISGSLRLKSGNRFIFTMTLSTGGQKQEMELRSDGKKLLVRNGDAQSESTVRGGSGALMVAALTRSGYMAFFIALNSNLGDEALPAPDVFLKVSGPKDVTDAKDPSQDRTLKFTVAVQKLGDLKTELVLANKTLLPKKLTGVLRYGGEDVKIVETYEEVSTEEIADSEFELKK